MEQHDDRLSDAQPSSWASRPPRHHHHRRRHHRRRRRHRRRHPLVQASSCDGVLCVERC